MQIDKYLQEYQPIIYKTFVNALETNKLSHAYLLSGSVGMPLKEVALYLAKSLICDNPNPLACNECITCMRVDEGNYADIMVFGDGNSKIKKGDIEKITSNFDKTALEEKGIMIYVLHLVESMTAVAVNSLLKFLEEPGQKVYAFLTTNNENSVLPTIISRCQVLRLKLIDKSIVIQTAVEEGVEKKDAELLSYFYNDGELIKEILDNQESNTAFFTAKACFEEVIQVLADGDYNDAIYHSQSNIVNKIKSKESCRYFINMLVMAFEDMINIKNQKNVFLESYATILENLSAKLSHLDESLIELLKCSGAVNANVNIPLLIDHLFYTIVKED